MKRGLTKVENDDEDQQDYKFSEKDTLPVNNSNMLNVNALKSVARPSNLSAAAPSSRNLRDRSRGWDVGGLSNDDDESTITKPSVKFQ